MTWRPPLLRRGAEPSGNSVALMNLLRLHALTTEDRYRAAADRLLQAFEGTLRRNPRALTEMLLAMEFRASGPKEVVVVVGDDPGQAEPFLEQLRSRFSPHKVVVIVSHETDRDALARRVPPSKGKLAREGKTTAYVNKAFACCPQPTRECSRSNSRRRSLRRVRGPR